MNKAVKIFFGILLVIGLLMTATYFLSKSGQGVMDDDVRIELNKEFVSLKHGSVHYEWSGPDSGEMVVLVHGFSTPSFVFTPIVRSLTTAGYRVLIYDHYGRGFSDRPSMDYSKEVYDDELMELLNALNIKQPINLMGYSMGGGIATVFAGNHPERVKRLMLMGPIGFLPEPTGTRKMLGLPVIGNWLMTVVGKKTMIDEFYTYVENGDAPLSIAEQFEEQFNYSGVESALVSTIQHFDMGSLADEYIKLGKVDIPKIMIWGAQDDVCPIAGAIEISKVVPNIELYRIEDGGHAIAYSHADEVSGAMIEFLQNE